MRVIALKQGYFGRLIDPGQTFNVAHGQTASWFKPESVDATDLNAQKAAQPASKVGRVRKQTDAPQHKSEAVP